MSNIKNNGYRDFNEQFDELQTEYLKTRDNCVLGKMYKLTYKYQITFMKNYCKEKNLIFEKDVLEQKSHDAATWFIDMYLRRPDFKVDRFTAYMTFPFRKIFFKNAKEELLVRKINSMNSDEAETWIEDAIRNTDNFNELGLEILGLMKFQEENKNFKKYSETEKNKKKKNLITPHDKEQSIIKSYFKLFERYKKIHPELEDQLKIQKEKLDFFILKHLIP